MGYPFWDLFFFHKWLESYGLHDRYRHRSLHHKKYSPAYRCRFCISWPCSVVVGGLDEVHPTVLLAPGVVFFAFKACIYHRFTVPKFLKRFHHRNESSDIATLLGDECTYDIFGIDCQYRIVCC